jgi:hypothetical protein
MSAMFAVAASLRASLDEALPWLRAIGESQSARPPAPGKWCAREIIGHLIDSAVNNHARFVRAQIESHLDFPGYEQEDWVRLQRYAETPWTELLALWTAYNSQLARIIEAIPDAVALERRSRHSLDRIASREVPATEPTTLGYLIEDYVWHLRHHLEQVRAIARGPA